MDKHSANNCWCTGQVSFDFWNFLEFFLFPCVLIESMDVEPMDMEGQR